MADSPTARKKSPWRWVFIAAIAVFAICAVALALIAGSYLQGQQVYGQLEDNVEAATSELDSMTVDWQELESINPDIVAWVLIPGTNVSYPVVRGEDNSFYLTHDFYESQGWIANFGTIFMDYRNNPDFSDDGYFIYGHHMNDGSMFADIAAMADQAKFDEARTVYLLTPNGNLKLRSFALLHVSPDDSLIQLTFPDDAERIAYLQGVMDGSVTEVSDAPPASEIPQYFAFSTCDNMSGRYVLYAYEVESTLQRSPSNKGN